MLNKKEQVKQEIIKCCCDGLITEKDASLRLNLSERQVRRLKAKVRGGSSLLHGNCGKLPANSLSFIQKQAILDEFAKLEHLNINFNHFCKLIQNKPFSASYSAVSNVLKSNGKTSSKAHKRKRKVHKMRERREKFGELIQGDGTPFDWFNSGKLQCLHVLIDDATGILTGLHISKNECMDGYFEASRQMLETYGTPEALYVDGSSIFFSNKHEELTIEEQLSGIESRKTQFGEICDTLGIELIHAHSPQAKGRVERANQTLQGRLPVEFAIRNITTIDEANRFLKEEFIHLFNNEFAAVEAEKSIFVPLPKAVNLDELLAWKTTRKTDKGCQISLNGTKFVVDGFVANKTVEILISKRIGVVARHNDSFYNLFPLAEGRGGKISASDSKDMILQRFIHFHTLRNQHYGS